MKLNFLVTAAAIFISMIFLASGNVFASTDVSGTITEDTFGDRQEMLGKR